MNQSFLTELFLYRHRYSIAYCLLGLLAIALIVIRIGEVPPGYSLAEQASAVQSFSLQFTTNINVIDLPYHLLQKASLKLFGLNEWGVRLPSMLIGLGLATGMFFLFKRWFARNMAVMGTTLGVTSALFLLHGRSGTSLIMISFWAILIILLATLRAQQTKRQPIVKVLLIAVIGLSLYTPYMTYLVATMVIAALVHPHLRYILRHTDKFAFAIAVCLGGLLLAPLAWYIYQHPATWTELLGIPAQLPSVSTYLQQLFDTIRAIGDVTKPQISIDLLPIFGIPAIALLLLGLARSIMDYHSSRSHLLLIWIGLLLPVVALQPASIPVLFVPLICLTAIGLNALVRMWYGLFPRNPYARIFALLPIGVLLLTIVQFNYVRYFIGLPHSPAATSFYNADGQLLRRTIEQQKLTNKPLIVVAETQDVSFYQIESEHSRQLKAGDVRLLAGASGPIIIAEQTYAKLPPEQKAALGQPTRLVVNSLQNNSLRFRVFTR